MDYFEMSMTERQANALSILALAHVGDAVYELMVRSMLCSGGSFTVDRLHKMTVAIVNAPAQAAAAERLLPLLSAEELALYKRGRNAKVNSVPHNAELAQYHAATALEALFGWLYLQGRTQRLSELFAAAAEGHHAT